MGIAGDESNYLPSPRVGAQAALTMYYNYKKLRKHSNSWVPTTWGFCGPRTLLVRFSLLDR